MGKGAPFAGTDPRPAVGLSPCSNTPSKARRHGFSQFQLPRGLLWGFDLGLEGGSVTVVEMTCLDPGNNLAGSVDCRDQLCPGWVIF